MAGRRQFVDKKMNEQNENTDRDPENSNNISEDIDEKLENLNLDENEPEHELLIESKHTLELLSNQNDNIQDDKIEDNILLKSLNTTTLDNLAEIKSDNGLLPNDSNEPPLEVSAASTKYCDNLENPKESILSVPPFQQPSTSKYVSVKQKNKNSSKPISKPDKPKRSNQKSFGRFNGSGILGEEMSPIYKFDIPVLPDKPTLLIPCEEEMNLMYPEENDKLQKFFMDQTIETLLECCSFSDSNDLIKIRIALRDKLQMDVKPWEDISLPANFIEILRKLSFRVHQEIDDHARVIMFKIFLDLVERYKNDAYIFHEYIGFFYSMDERLEFHFFCEKEKTDILLEEFEVLKKINEWVTETYVKLNK